jgi:hypothetical protein
VPTSGNQVVPRNQTQQPRDTRMDVQLLLQTLTSQVMKLNRVPMRLCTRLRLYDAASICTCSVVTCQS